MVIFFSSCCDANTGVEWGGSSVAPSGWMERQVDRRAGGRTDRQGKVVILEIQCYPCAGS